MKQLILFTTLCLISSFAMSEQAALDTTDPLEVVAIRYFEFLFFEDQARENQSEQLMSTPRLASFHSKDGKRMIIVSSMVSSEKSYTVLMSVNELNMGFLAWKQRGYGKDPVEDIKYLMQYDGKEFNFEDW